MGPETALVNSFDFAKEAVMRAMSTGERDEALYVLGRADQSDSMVQALTHGAARGARAGLGRPMPPQRFWQRVTGWWTRFVGRRWFRGFVLWLVHPHHAGLAAEPDHRP